MEDQNLQLFINYKKFQWYYDPVIWIGFVIAIDKEYDLLYIDDDVYT